MALLDISALLITLAAIFGYINLRTLRLPTTIGIMLISISVSLLVVVLGALGIEAPLSEARDVVSRIDFDEALMHGMLSFLLFAGALHVDLGELARFKWIVGTLASVGVIATTFMVGSVAWVLFQLLGIDLPYLHCLVFGALIAPTDPVAVMALLKSVGVPRSLETKIAGESLFNDGVAVVVFLVLVGIAFGGQEASVGSVVELFVTEAIGGLVFGLGLGFIAFRMLASIDNYQVEVLITLGLVAGGYSLAHHLHLSGPIAMVVAGLMIGNRGRALAMSERTRERLDDFWELIDEVLNAVLFLIIGIELLVIVANPLWIVAGCLLIPVVLGARWVSVWVPVQLLRELQTFGPNVVQMLTWGGLRGGISIALALSLPAGESRDLLVTASYCIVVFSILVQG
ncbi:MAG: sodium:proton antiporter, partial [Gammaproteobacteria bacterium]|nr:sodium:proton antiporter [Gammaproteobacteria bacterium]